MELNPEQRQAVERAGQDVCVSAGPGSGKTRVLVARFAWLVARDISPLRILTITFTEKAANEIKRRLVDQFRDNPGIRAQIERAYVSTIDSFCTRLLRENAIAAGLDPGFSIQEDLLGLVDPAEVAEQVLEQLFAEKPAEMRRLLDGLASSDLASSLCAVYNAMRAAGIAIGELSAPADPDVASAMEWLEQAAAGVLGPVAKRDPTPEQRELLQAQREWARGVRALGRDRPVRDYLEALASFDCNLNQLKWTKPVYEDLRALKQEVIPAIHQRFIAAFYASERALLQEALARFDTEFRRRKREASVLDFADLEEFAIRMLRQDERLRTRIQRGFDAILMDELQDTNRLQWRLVDLLRRPDNFFAVGDINQSIFGFRYAEPEVFRSYRKTLEDAGRQVDRLRLNHRSRPEILGVVTRVLSGEPGIEEFAFQAVGDFEPKQEPSVEIIAAYGEDAEAGSKLEAEWIARRIRELESRGARFSDMAVLIRTVGALDALAPAFERCGIPFLLTRGKSFFEQREVLDLLHWLRVLRNPLDEVSLLVVLRSPLVGVSDETILRLEMLGNLGEVIRALDQQDASSFEAGDLERLHGFREQLRWMRAAADDVSPDRLLTRALDDSGYLRGLTWRARGNIEKFLSLVRETHTSRPRPLARLIGDLETLRESQPEPDAPPVDAPDAVRVLTIHGAKGLEFPIVFVAALHRGTNRRRPAVGFSPESGLEVQWRDPATGKSEPTKLEEDEEANRLLYVAMTRAEEHLVLSFAATDRAPANWAKQLVVKLGLDLETFDNQPAMHDGIRLLRVSQAPAWDGPIAAAAVTEPAELAPPAVTDQYDSAASATSIALFHACPRRYYLGRYLGWPETPSRAPGPALEEPQDSDLEASELGRQVHALLARQPVENPDPEALELAGRFPLSGLGRREARASRLEREFDFVMAADDVVVTGQIDLWFEEGGELVLVDYKTDREMARAEDYQLQLRLYALALERLTGRLPDQGWLYYLRHDSPVQVSLDAASMTAARAAVRNFRQAQSGLEFPLQEGDHCLSCGYYKGLCPGPLRL